MTPRLPVSPVVKIFVWIVDTAEVPRLRLTHDLKHALPGGRDAALPQLYDLVQHPVRNFPL